MLLRSTRSTPRSGGYSLASAQALRRPARMSSASLTSCLHRPTARCHGSRLRSASRPARRRSSPRPGGRKPTPSSRSCWAARTTTPRGDTPRPRSSTSCSSRMRSNARSRSTMTPRWWRRVCSSPAPEQTGRFGSPLRPDSSSPGSRYAPSTRSSRSHRGSRPPSRRLRADCTPAPPESSCYVARRGAAVTQSRQPRPPAPGSCRSAASEAPPSSGSSRARESACR